MNSSLAYRACRPDDEFSFFTVRQEAHNKMARQGRSLSEEQIQKIIHLLISTDMTICDIAKRMGCSHSVIVSINRKYRVRQYAGLRREWTLLRRA